MWNSISACDIDMRRELANNIIVAGGNTMFDGFLERLTREVTSLAHPGAEINVLTSSSNR